MNKEITVFHVTKNVLNKGAWGHPRNRCKGPGCKVTDEVQINNVGFTNQRTLNALVSIAHGGHHGVILDEKP